MKRRQNLITEAGTTTITISPLLGILFFCCILESKAEFQPTHPALVKSEFIFEEAPFPSCHASTIVETPFGLLAAWFGGTHERHPDVGIWVSRWESNKWTFPTEVANGVMPGGERYPCWNPVLFQPRTGPLVLFYRVGPSPSTWWTMYKISHDGGRTWSEPGKLPDGIFGPIKNKPIELGPGRLICGSSTEGKGGWRVHFEITESFLEGWWRGDDLRGQGKIEAIQPTILIHPEGILQTLCRTRQGKIAESWSYNGGHSWSPLRFTALPNPNSGIDAITLADGRHLLVYNHSSQNKVRTPLNVAISTDGKNWIQMLTLEDEPSAQFSYPAVIQSSDGMVHITYTWKRLRIKHVVLNPRRF